MSDPTMLFAEGGPTMWAILLLDLIGAVVVFVALALAVFSRATGKGKKGSKVVAVLAILGCFLPLCCGLTGYAYGNYQLQQALQYADPELMQEMMAHGEALAGIPLKYGACSSLCCVLPAFLALFILTAGEKQSKWEEIASD